MLWLGVIPTIPFLISSLSLPSSFVMQFVSRTIHTPADPNYFAYLVGVGTILQMFLLGLVFEFLVDKISKLLGRNRVAGKALGPSSQ